MESTSIDFISFWPTASSMLALRLCTLKSLTKIGRLISATSSGRTLVNFETKASRSAFRRFSHEFLRACEHGAEALCRIAIGLEPALLGEHRGDVHVRDVFLVRIADHANIARLLQDREERLLIEPDWQISRIRLSDKTSRLRTAHTASNRSCINASVICGNGISVS